MASPTMHSDDTTHFITPGMATAYFSLISLASTAVWLGSSLSVRYQKYGDPAEILMHTSRDAIYIPAIMVIHFYLIYLTTSTTAAEDSIYVKQAADTLNAVLSDELVGLYLRQSILLTQIKCLLVIMREIASWIRNKLFHTTNAPNRGMHVKDRIRSAIEGLKEIIEPDYGLLDHLISRRVLTFRECSKVNSETDVYDRLDHLLKLMMTKSEEQCRDFLLALQETDQQHAVNYIQNQPDIGAEFGDVRPLDEARIRHIAFNTPRLVEFLDPDVGLLADLEAAGSITHQQRSIINDLQITSDKNRKLLDILRRRSVAHFRLFVNILAKNKQSHLIPLVTKTGVIVNVDATLDGSSDSEISQSEDQIVASFRDMLPDCSEEVRVQMQAKTEEYQEFARSLGVEVHLVVIEKQNSIGSYFFCETSDSLQHLRSLYESGELRQILESIFSVLRQGTDRVRINRLAWLSVDYENCLKYFYEDVCERNAERRKRPARLKADATSLATSSKLSAVRCDFGMSTTVDKVVAERHHMAQVFVSFVVWICIEKWIDSQLMWIVNNIVGLAMSVFIIERCRFNKTTSGLILMGAMLICDVIVAFDTGPILKVSESSNNVPVILSFPKDLLEEGIYNANNYATLGLSGVFIPGAFVAFLLRFDVSLGQNRKTYFSSTLIAYYVGLGVTFLIARYKRTPQPTLLYVIPPIVITTLVLAWMRGELGVLFKYEERIGDEILEEETAQVQGERTDAPRGVSTYGRIINLLENIFIIISRGCSSN